MTCCHMECDEATSMLHVNLLCWRVLQQQLHDVIAATADRHVER